MRHQLLAGAAALALAGAGTLALAGPALAAPACTGAACSTTGTVQVQATISETIDNAAFSFNGGSPVAAGSQAGPAPYYGAYSSAGPDGGTVPDYSLTIATGDVQGFTVTGAGTPFTAPGGASFPLSALTVYDVTGGPPWSGPITLTTSPAQIASGPATPLAGVTYAFADAVQVPANAGNDPYSTTLSYAAIAG